MGVYGNVYKCPTVGTQNFVSWPVPGMRPGLHRGLANNTSGHKILCPGLYRVRVRVLSGVLPVIRKPGVQRHAAIHKNGCARNVIRLI